LAPPRGKGWGQDILGKGFKKKKFCVTKKKIFGLILNPPPPQ